MAEFSLLLLIRFCGWMLVAWPGQWLWNDCLVPATTTLNPVSYWQMVGITALITLISYKHINMEKFTK